MSRHSNRQLPLLQVLVPVLLFVLCGCSRAVPVVTVLEDTGGLQPGDKVYLGALEVGSVAGIQVTEQTPDFTVEVRLDPEQVGLIQGNAVAYVPFDEPARLVVMNPTEPAEPVARGGRLQGLSPFGAALWEAREAAGAASDLVDLFARKVDGYFGSDDWAETREQIDAEVAELAADSSEAAERIAEEFRGLVEAIADGAREGSDVLRDDITALEQHLDRLDAEGYHDLAASLRRLLARVEALTAPAEAPPTEAREAP